MVYSVLLSLFIACLLVQSICLGIGFSKGELGSVLWCLSWWSLTLFWIWLYVTESKNSKDN